jgi:hypothetical protein
MAIALIVMRKLASGSKVVTRIRGLSIRTGIRGFFKTGTPGIVLVSTPKELDPPDLPGPDLENFKGYVYTIGGYDKKDKQIQIQHEAIAPRMSIAFEKEKIRRQFDIPKIIEEAERLGSGGDITKWLNKELDNAARHFTSKPDKNWYDVWGDGSTKRHASMKRPTVQRKNEEGEVFTIRKYFAP